MIMGFGQSIATCMRKYATFSGRASRSEFWWFYLSCYVIVWIADVVGLLAFPVNLPPAADELSLADIPAVIVSLALLMPSLAAGARRLHDVGRSGWWQLLILTGIGYILVIVWWVLPSRQEDNKHGSPPARVAA